MGYEPEGIIEKSGDMIGVASRRVESDLKRFKEFIESKASDTGAWRGKIERRLEGLDVPSWVGGRPRHNRSERGFYAGSGTLQGLQAIDQ